MLRIGWWLPSPAGGRRAGDEGARQGKKSNHFRTKDAVFLSDRKGVALADSLIPNPSPAYGRRESRSRWLENRRHCKGEDLLFTYSAFIF